MRAQRALIPMCPTAGTRAFQKLGEYYQVGNLFLIIYAACNAVGQFSTLVLSIDAPLRMLLDNEDAREFIPTKLLKKNKYGAYINGIWMVVILSGSIIAIQSFVPGAAAVLTQLNKLNSVTMPLRYLWVFAAYIALRRCIGKFNPEYRFTKRQGLAFTAGICASVSRPSAASSVCTWKAIWLPQR